LALKQLVVHRKASEKLIPYKKAVQFTLQLLEVVLAKSMIYYQWP
jgi:hypothetical protein